MLLSCIILTKNEEQNIIDCIESVIDFCNEIIVVDDNSTDMTLEVLKQFTKKKVTFYSKNLINDFSGQRNFGLSKANSQWVLFLDADERVNLGLKKEIQNVLSSDGVENFDGFLLKRTDVMWGRELRHGETGRIELLRLGRKGKGLWRGKVHEKWEIKGKIGRLKNPLFHYPHRTVREFLTKINFYTSIRARELIDKGVKVNLFQIMFFPLVKFSYNFLFKMGFLDGAEGFIIATLMSFHSFLVRGKIWLLTKEK